MELPVILLPIIGVPLLLLLLVHLGFRAPRIAEHGTPERFGLPFHAVSIATVAGRHLFGWWLPVATGDVSIVILHGWGGNAEMMLPLALPFHRAGINVLLIDARNHGRSDRHGHSSLPRFAEDVGHAVDWLRSAHPQRARRMVLLGHSLGAAAVLFEASRRSDIDAVISISAFAHPAWMMRRHLDRWWLPRPLAALIMRYVEWVIGHRFDEIAPLRTICRIQARVLLVHGTDDRTVPLADAHAIAATCRQPHVTLLEIPGADHDSVEAIERHGAGLIRFLADAGLLSGSTRPVGEQQTGDHQGSADRQ
ncbi:MAG TPA: alpha/beta fold hydrolase [Sedimenticola thiotaurini]|uniref:Alpha/beta fold hydrolase n=1 Tax=Sedimenticola thiotaurini TaxID=1543721 RepID=A0A831RL72_9GAMM|nr:alpha/beta fold hydrolase [Sedimenticola thiotaurini]